MGKKDFYDPYTMRVKDIEELVPELSKIVMSQLPGSPALATVWSVLCEAAQSHKMALETMNEHGGDYTGFRAHGEQYVAAGIIRKIADGMGVSNFKEREVKEPTET